MYRSQQLFVDPYLQYITDVPLNNMHWQPPGIQLPNYQNNSQLSHFPSSPQNQSQNTHVFPPPINIQNKQTISQRHVNAPKAPKTPKSPKAIRKKYPKDENRNLKPNIINRIITFITHYLKSSSLILQIALSKGLERFPIKNFYYFMNAIKNDKIKSTTEKFFENFFIIKYPEQILPIKEQEQFLQVSRIAILLFLQKEAKVEIQRSQKMTNKAGHMKCVDELKNAFEEMVKRAFP